MSRPIIEVKNFTKRYGKLEAVKNISFDVAEGQLFIDSKEKQSASFSSYRWY